jgi:hypothetical protein
MPVRKDGPYMTAGLKTRRYFVLCVSGISDTIV